MSSLRTDWKGVFPPIVTPFTKTEEIDEAAFRKVIDLLIAEGVHGIIVAGSTGEWYSLADDEVSRLLEVAKDQIADRVPLLAGTSSMSTRHAVALTERAAKSGCAGAMVLPPPYVLPSADEVVAHFEAVAGVGLPIMVYNNPKRTQVNLDAALMERIAAFDSIVAMKDSVKDLYQASETIKRVGDQLAYFTGMEPYGNAILARGGVGFVSMMANICGSDVVAYYDHAGAGRWTEGRRHERVIEGLYEIDLKFGRGIYPTVKACMNILGRYGGHLRRPYMDIEDRETLGKLARALADLGLAAESSAAAD